MTETLHVLTAVGATIATGLSLTAIAYDLRELLGS